MKDARKHFKKLAAALLTMDESELVESLTDAEWNAFQYKYGDNAHTRRLWSVLISMQQNLLPPIDITKDMFVYKKGAEDSIFFPKGLGEDGDNTGFNLNTGGTRKLTKKEADDAVKFYRAPDSYDLMSFKRIVNDAVAFSEAQEWMAHNKSFAAEYL